MKNTCRRFFRSLALVGLFAQINPAISNAQIFPVDTIRYNGNPSKFINLVFLSDGFQGAELSTFTSNVQNFTGYLFEISPFKEYANYFNVFAINVPSVDSGASHPGTASDVTEPAFPVASVNNYFGSRFDVSSIHRLLAPANFGSINSVMINSFPQFDQRLILVNSPYYGGSGGSIATASLNGSSFEIMVHEMGHSFAGLSDEYYAGDGFASEKMNMTKETNPTLVKWKNWLDEDGVGIYQHCCGGNSAQWYRPHQGCKMRFLGSGYPFCPVCKETLFERIHAVFGTPVLSYQPNSSAIISCSEPIMFKLSTVKPVPNTLKVTWNLNGTVLPNTTDSIMISVGQAAAGINTLSATIMDTTSLTRSEAHFQSHSHTINWTFQFDSPTVPFIMADGSLVSCQGDSVTLSASAAANYAWNNGANTQSITVTNTGDYTVTVTTANGCSAESAITSVIVYAAPNVPTISATDSSLVSSADSGNQWHVDGTIIPGANTQTYTPTQTGLYAVVTTDMNGCTAASAPHYFLVSSVYDLNSASDFVIIPNPNDGRFSVRTGQLPCTYLKIYNGAGVLVHQRDQMDTNIDVGHLAKGAYVLECSCAGKTYSRKLVIQQ